MNKAHGRTASAPFVFSQRFALSALPEQPVPLARVLGAHGIKGALRLKMYAANSANIRALKSAWIIFQNQASIVKISAVRSFDDEAVITLDGLSLREDAAQLAGAEIVIRRDQLVAPATDEFYWSDLIGCQVLNTCGADLGIVDDLVSTGAHDVISIHQLTPPQTRLIPFVNAYVREVSISQKRITVEWDADWD